MLPNTTPSPLLPAWLSWLPERIVQAAADWPRATLIVALLATIVGIAVVESRFAISTDNEDMLSEDLPFRQNDRAMKAVFPNDPGNLVVVIEAPTPDKTNAMADLVAERLRAEPDRYGIVSDLAADPFFRRNGLLYLSISELESLSDRLARAQPFLASLAQQPDLMALLDLLDQALSTAASGRELPVDLAPVLSELAAFVEAHNQGKPVALSWARLLAGGTAAGPTRRIILLDPPLNYGSLQPARAAIDGLKALRQELLLDGDGTASARLSLTGSAYLEQQELQSVEQGMGLAGVLSLVSVLVLLGAGLRSVRRVIGLLLALVAGLVWTAAFAFLTVGELNLISVAFAVLFIGLSVDFGIHFALRTSESTGPAREAVRSAAEGVGAALLLAAAMAAIGFFSFLPTNYQGLAQLGLIAGGGMGFALLANLTVLPAWLVLTGGRDRSTGGTGDSRLAINTGGLNRSGVRLRLASFALLGVFSVLMLPEARFDFDPLNLRDDQTESVETLNRLMVDPMINAYGIDLLVGSAEEAERLARELAALPSVDAVQSIAAILPEEQEEKLLIIGDLALILEPALTVSAVETARPVPEAAVLRERAERFEALSRSLDFAGREWAMRLTRGLLESRDILSLERAMFLYWPRALHQLREALEAGPVGMADLPEAIRNRMLAPNGQQRLSLSPAIDPTDPKALKAFVREVQSVAPTATGTAVIIVEAGTAVVDAFWQAGLITVGLIAMLLVLILRQLRAVVLVFLPLLLAAVITAAASALVQVPFNFANIIVLPLLFGLGVAGAIHLVVREAQGLGSQRDLSTTPKAVTYSALTTIASFGSIALSSHPGTASMGVLLAIAVLATLLTTLLFLPALLHILPPKRKGV
ncbi:MAG: MMPL family transporter [Magnetovibrionaceae bacterium]